MGLLERLHRLFGRRDVLSDAPEGLSASVGSVSTGSVPAPSAPDGPEWVEVPAFVDVGEGGERALVSAVAAAIAAGDRPSSRLAVRLVARFNPEYRRVALVASSLAAGERPTSALTCVRVFRRDGRKGEETHAS